MIHLDQQSQPDHCHDPGRISSALVSLLPITEGVFQFGKKILLLAGLASYQRDQLMPSRAIVRILFIIEQ